VLLYSTKFVGVKSSRNTYSKSGHLLLEHRSPFPSPQLFAHLHLWEKCVLKTCECTLKVFFGIRTLVFSFPHAGLHSSNTASKPHDNLNYGTNIAAKAGISNHGDAHITLRLPDQQKRIADILVGRPIIIYGAFVYVPVICDREVRIC
jgi:hypothetical protein